MTRWFETAACLGALVAWACGDGGSGGACEAACAHMVECGDLEAGEKGGCVDDCSSEPWSASFIACRTETCGRSDAECEAYGRATCESACDHMIECGDLEAGERDDCLTECSTEPWPDHYVECRATTCGKSEAECESWTG
ncbi:MAG: hypothetical protein JXR96_22175 [Deltaproteobacteria bacterium]|nr:hypothetical protein [Deltaproteobacteria bacterium]